MAYAFPSTEPGGPASSTSLHPVPSGKSSRKGSEEGFDVLKEFKLKIEEDDSYIEFFQERIRIEEQYIKQLQKLYDRTVAIDTLHDDQLKQRTRTSARKGWTEVRDYTSREIDSRNALIMALRTAIIPDLARIKDEQERIRLGLRENLRTANDMYDDHLKHHIPKLKKTYWQKCQALEDHKRQEAAIAAQARLLSTPSPSSPAGSPMTENPATLFNSNLSPQHHATVSPPSHPISPQVGLTETPYFSPPRNNPSLPTSDRSNAVAFTPSHPSRPSTSSGRNRDRAGSGTGGQGEKKDPKEVFQDLAVQSKKGFNAFMQKLGGDKGEREREEGGFVFVGGGGKEDDGMGLQRKTTNRGGHGKGQETGALRAVRAKREVDDADKAYRTGVFHLESLRLRREKVQASALTNLEQFNDELSIKLQNALTTYVDIVHATAATNAQATEVVRKTVDRIDPGRDMQLFRSRIMSFKGLQTAAVPYENFYVGPCRSLIFGVSLTDYDFARGEGGDHGRPPVIVEKCLSAIDQKGLDAEGLYRISGRKAGVQKMIQDIELDEEKFEFEDLGDVHSIANVLKQYLRELPEPVFLLPHSERVKYTLDREQLIHSNFSALRSRLRRLPPIHQTTFQAIIEHLGRVQSRSSQNKMDAKNLAVIFNSVLFGADTGPEATALVMHHQQDTVLEDLITFSDLLFSADFDLPATQPAPGRAGATSEHAIEDGPNFGSSRTKMKIIETAPTEEPGIAASVTSSIAAAVAMVGDSLGLTNQGDDSAPIRGELTPDSKLELLFDPGVIPASFREAVGADYQVRPLSSTDLLRSHFTLLTDLTSSPAIAPSLYSSIFTHLRSCPQTYYIVVLVDKSDDQLVAAGTLFIERKHIHGGGVAGHIEDIVVSGRTQGKGLGGKLVKGLKDMGEGLGCYKTILDCKEEKVGFYEKCGFTRRGVQMAYYSATTDVSPMFAPSVPPVTTSRQGSSLALPELRAPPLPPRPAEYDSSSVQGTSIPVPPPPVSLVKQTSPKSEESHTSSESRVTYTYPITTAGTASTSAAHPAIYPAPIVDLSSSPTASRGKEFPAWATEGLGNTSLAKTTKGESPERERKDSLTRPYTPLPPGAAPPDLTAEPERVAD